VKSLPPGEGGFHLDKHKQPYAKVIATPKNDGWTIAASHETLEMLLDPYGNRLQSSVEIEIKANKIVDGTGQYGYLVEACDPCEDDKFGYTINGVVVSDFITPHFYDPMVTPGHATALPGRSRRQGRFFLAVISPGSITKLTSGSSCNISARGPRS
jgi:hypothetical protein